MPPKTLRSILRQAGLSENAPMKYVVIYEAADNGGYGAYVPDLPGCVAAGDSLDEVRTLIREAIELHLSGMREDGDAIPPPTTQNAA